MFTWLAGRLLTAVQGDRDIVNCVAAHPHQPLLASCGLDPSVKLFGPHYGGEQSTSQCIIEQCFPFLSLTTLLHVLSRALVLFKVVGVPYGHISTQKVALNPLTKAALAWAKMTVCLCFCVTHLIK